MAKNVSMTIYSIVSKGMGTQWINRPFRSSHPLDAIKNAYRLANDFSRTNQIPHSPGSTQANHFLL